MTNPMRFFSPTHVPFVHRFDEPDNFQNGENENRKNTKKREWRRKSNSDLASVINAAVTELLSRAVSGDDVAAGHLLRELSIAVGRLESLVHRQKEICERLARRATQWPLLVTRNPCIWKAQYRMLEALHLSEDTMLPMHRFSKTTLESPATRYAISIICTLNDNRDTWAELTLDRAPSWVREAQELPILTKETAPSWWDAGKKAFLEAHSNPERIPVLRKLATTKESESQKRALILELLGRAIRGLASK